MQIKPEIAIREITPADYPHLENFLYHAIFIPPGEEYPKREIIYEPEIYIYIKDFGGKDDCGVIAEQDGKLIGAAWTRIIPAYGNIDTKTPELAISILPDSRGQGIGTNLMTHLFKLLKQRGYNRTSLSVQQNNPAVRFYKRLGYVVTDEKLDHDGNEDFIMVKMIMHNEKD
ncbi:MAG: GNAT family N-acetyltransferase [Defluviitaleaceae bacterium]|nr:GNAT family N-acetyltransferase [Defluviitaleaceae bacterium]